MPAELPIAIFENVAARCTVSATPAAASGYPAGNMIDFLHHTYYEASTNANIVITVDPSGSTPAVDHAIVDTHFADAGGSIAVVRGGVTVATKSGITKGVNKISFASGAITTSMTITITSSLSAKRVRHVCVGLADVLKNPVLNHDPDQEDQIVDDFENENGSMVSGHPMGSFKILDATFANLDATLQAAFIKMRDENYRKRLPFWYFDRPTTYPTRGYLYWLDKGGWQMPFTSGMRCTITINAKANIEVDRTSPAY